MKKLLFTAALMSLVFLGSCAKGGSGPCAVNCPSVQIEPNIGEVGLNVSVPLTLTFENVAASPVDWSITPSSCGSACGTLTNVTASTATYVGPSTVPSNPSFSIVATSQTDSSLTDTLPLTIIPVTTNVNPVSPSVGVGLTQEYAAAAAPGQAPQTFTWTCTTALGACANFTIDQNLPGLAYYMPTLAEGQECSGGGCVTVSAVAAVDPTGCTINPKFPCTASTTSVVSQRLDGMYAFKFSGYDKNGKAVAAAGTFTVGSSGSISSGFEDIVTTSGLAQYSFSGGSYTPLNGGNNSNNAGTLSLSIAGNPFPSSFNVVLDGAGDIQMIASDSAGDSGSGVAEPSSVNKFVKEGAATYAFGFTGVDASNNRIGYVGILPTDGVSSVSGGWIDVNDNGSASNSVCGSAPCAVAGSYSYSSTTNQGQITLTSPKAMTFDFFVANGTSSANSPLTLYAISTDSNPAVVGSIVLQDAKKAPYTNAVFNGTSVSALTGTNDNVALILLTTFGDDGSSGVTGACPNSSNDSGSLEGNFDQNNAGTIVSVSTFPGTGQASNPYTYVSTNGNTGRYVFCLLGNPNAKGGAVLPIPFVLYASGANSGFLLDQSSPSVMTGTMIAQPSIRGSTIANSTAIGSYAVATNSNSVSNPAGCSLLPACFATMNLLVTAPVVAVPSQIVLASNVTGTENPNNMPVSWIFNVGTSGYGTIGPLAPATTPPNYVIYGLTATDYFMIDVDSGVTSPILYMAQ